MVDLYTKAVLTVIAAALTLLAAQGLIRPVGAQTGDIQKVQICDTRRCASLSPRSTQIGSAVVTDWVIPTQIDDIQKVKICSDSATSCATIDSDLRTGAGSLRVSSR